MTVAPQYLRHSQIDRQQWDACLDRHFPDLLYLRSWFLDEMVPGWEALVDIEPVTGQYFGIMALPVRKKWGLRFLYQPYLTAQLGYVGKDNSRLRDFLAAIPGSFRYLDFCLNEKNSLPPGPGGGYIRHNLVLDLSPSAGQLSAAFHTNTRRNLRKARTHSLSVETADNWQLAWDFFCQHSITPPGEQEKPQCEALLEKMKSLGQLETYVVKNNSGQLAGSCIFCWQGARAYYLFPATDPAFRNSGASPLLIDAFIARHAGSPVLLDFEGSDIESVARFYEGFGAVDHPYPAIRQNRLPFPLRFLKR